jgi:hypothetical protein
VTRARVLEGIAKVSASVSATDRGVGPEQPYDVGDQHIVEGDITCLRGDDDHLGVVDLQDRDRKEGDGCTEEELSCRLRHISLSGLHRSVD